MRTVFLGNERRLPMKPKACQSDSPFTARALPVEVRRRSLGALLGCALLRLLERAVEIFAGAAKPTLPRRDAVQNTVVDPFAKLERTGYFLLPGFR